MALEPKRHCGAEAEFPLRSEQLQTVTEALTTFLSSGDWQAGMALLLQHAIDRTESRRGFAGVLVDGPVLRILCQTASPRARAACRGRGAAEPAQSPDGEGEFFELTDLDNLFGQVVTTGQAVIVNNPARDLGAGDLPVTSPPIHHFLAVPIRWGGEVVGLLAVANRPGGYTGTEQDQLELLSRTAGVLCDSYRRRQREAALEAQLHQSQRMEAIGLLAGGVAHDINNLLTVIIGHSELTLECLSPTDPYRKSIEEIRLAGERAAGLTRQLLAFSRRQVLQPRVIDLNAVVAGVDPMLRRLIGENITLLTQLDPELGKVQADPGRIEQVIMNLVVNARDAMPHGGRLTIETANVDLDPSYARQHISVQPGRYVMLAVSDTGSGMDKETQSRIFEPFFTTKERGKGTGLGLSTIYGIVKQSGGNIWVYSEPGCGTSFKIYLPRIDAPIDAVESKSDSSRPLQGSETLLLAEDEAAVRDLVRQTLENYGYHVLEAANADEALPLAERHPGTIHGLVTDVVMPGMSGRDLARRLEEQRPDLKVLYISGYTDDAIVHHGVLEAGIPFIEKPFTPEALARKVRDVLDTPHT